MKYLLETLGIKVIDVTLEGAASLPFFLTDIYEVRKIGLENTSCLFITPKAGLQICPGS